MNNETRKCLTEIEKDKIDNLDEEQDEEAELAYYCYKYGPCNKCKEKK